MAQRVKIYNYNFLECSFQNKQTLKENQYSEICTLFQKQLTREPVSSPLHTMGKPTLNVWPEMVIQKIAGVPQFGILVAMRLTGENVSVSHCHMILTKI